MVPKVRQRPHHIVARALRESEDDGSDILDLNAADFRTTSDLRDLVNQTQAYPMSGKYRVIILDECQTLTKEAKTMLLKPLEQEVSTVAWILCTMDVKSLDKALRDRCMAFELKPMGQGERRELVERAAAHLNYLGDTSRFLRSLDAKNVESARDVLRCFEKLCNGMSAEDAVGE